MPRHDEAAGPDRGHGGSEGADLTGSPSEHSKSASSEQPAPTDAGLDTTDLEAAIARLLAATPPARHFEVYCWIAVEGFTGLGRLCGVTGAATLAYKIADMLAADAK